MTFAWKYIALRVPDLRAAEGFYCRAFSMETLFREAERENAWHTLDAGLDWDRARKRGIDVAMVALRREAFVLALFSGTPEPGTVFELCVGVTSSEIEAIEARLGEAATVLESGPGFLRFLDPFGFQWAVQPADSPFRSSGEIAGRWVS